MHSTQLVGERIRDPSQNPAGFQERAEHPGKHEQRESDRNTRGPSEATLQRHSRLCSFLQVKQNLRFAIARQTLLSNGTDPTEDVALL